MTDSVTTVLVAGFVSAGLMTLVQSVGGIFGANVCTNRLAEEVPRQIANAATIWATANTVIFRSDPEPGSSWVTTVNEVLAERS